jgi:hypothetical protein
MECPVCGIEVANKPEVNEKGTCNICNKNVNKPVDEQPSKS